MRTTGLALLLAVLCISAMSITGAKAQAIATESQVFDDEDAMRDSDMADDESSFVDNEDDMEEDD